MGRAERAALLAGAQLAACAAPEVRVPAPWGRPVAGTDSLQFRDVHAVDAETAYLLSIGSGADSRIYRTDDGGRSWNLQWTIPDGRPYSFSQSTSRWRVICRFIAAIDSMSGISLGQTSTQFIDLAQLAIPPGPMSAS